WDQEAVHTVAHVLGDALADAGDDRLPELHRLAVDRAARLAPRGEREDVAPRHGAENLDMRSAAAQLDAVLESQIEDERLQTRTFRPLADDAADQVGELGSELRDRADQVLVALPLGERAHGEDDPSALICR